MNKHELFRIAFCIKNFVVIVVVVIVVVVVF